MADFASNVTSPIASMLSMTADACCSITIVSYAALLASSFSPLSLMISFSSSDSASNASSALIIAFSESSVTSPIASIISATSPSFSSISSWLYVSLLAVSFSALFSICPFSSSDSASYASSATLIAWSESRVTSPILLIKSSQTFAFSDFPQAHRDTSNTTVKINIITFFMFLLPFDFCF